MKTINVGKNDEVVLVVEKIINTDTDEITLIIPRFSHLAESISNFHLLKREVDILKKEIIIESVDNRVIELAKLSGFEANNPFLSGSEKRKQFSDIVLPEKKFLNGKNKKDDKLSEKYIREKIDGSRKEEKPPKEEVEIKAGTDEENRKSKEKNISQKLSAFLKKLIKLIILLILAGFSYWLVFWFLPKAEVKIVAQKSEWAYNDSVTGDKSARADFSKMIIPVQVFSQTKNFNLKFLASGRRQVENKAKGMITIYNSYSSDPQLLVQNTRFMSPDGKIFRLAKNTTVPGAKIVEGKVVSSNIEAAIIADQAGPDYNIGPTKLFTIPGLKGTPKYQAFYAESKEAMSGGFIGEVAYPTSDDIKAAKDNVAQILESSLKTAIYSQIPQEFKILEGASEFVILSQSVKEDIDEENKFSTFAEGKITVIAFKEEILKSILTERAVSEKGSDFEIKNTELKYGLARTDFKNGKLSFPIDFKVLLSRKIDAESLKNKIIGQPERELRQIIFSLPEVESANVSLWPFWVKKIPSNLNKVKIVID